MAEPETTFLHKYWDLISQLENCWSQIYKKRYFYDNYKPQMTQKDWDSHLSLFSKVSDCKWLYLKDFFMQNITRAATISFLSLNLTPCTMISILVLFSTTFDHFCDWFSFCIGHVCGLLITVLKSDGLVSILIVNKTVREYLLVHLSPFYQSFYSSCTSSRTPCYNLVD